VQGADSAPNARYQQGYVSYNSKSEGLGLWDAHTGDPVIKFGPTANISVNLWIDPNRGQAVVLHSDGVFRIWDLAEKRVIAQTAAMRAKVLARVVDFNGGYIAAVDKSGVLHEWTLDGAVIREFPVRVSDRTALSATLGHQWLFIEDNKLNETQFIPVGRDGDPFTVAGRGDPRIGDSTFWKWTNPNRRQFYRLADGASLFAIDGDDSDLSGMLKPDRFAIDGEDGDVEIHDMTSGNVMGRVSTWFDDESIGEPLGDGTFAMSTRSGAIEIRSSEDGDCVGAFTGHSGKIAILERSPAGDQLASSSEDGTVRLWTLPVTADPDACGD
jgi:WD40 repeat protein